MRFVLGLIAATSLSAADLSGIWIGQVTGRNGAVNDIAEQAGNEINDTRIRYTGSFVNGQLELVREREASTRAGSGGGVKLNESKQRLVLKRL